MLAGMAVIAFVLVFAAVVIARTTESYLVERVDAQLADAIVPRSAFGRFPGLLPAPSGTDSAASQFLNALYVARVDGNSLTVLVKPNVSPHEPGLPKIGPRRAIAAANAAHPANFTVSATHGSSGYRVRAVRAPDGATVVLALSLRDVDASVRRLVLVEIIATVSVIGILGLVTFWVLRLGVRPIKRMTATAAAIASGDLSQRVPAGHRGTEAGELSDALNAMLTRIEDAFDQRAASQARLRQFVADASHELRTPVTTIRGYAELFRHGGLSNEDDLAQAMRRTEQESVRMASLVDDLLLLARLDEGRPLERTTLDLGVLGIDAAADAQAASPDHEIAADIAVDVMVEGDEDRLRQVLANLVGNALVHTIAGTSITVRVHAVGSHAVVEVNDDGPGMPPEAAARAFERFWRADGSRSRHAGGSGLGLAIVKAIVESHGGSVSLRTAEGHGTSVALELPLAHRPAINGDGPSAAIVSRDAAQSEIETGNTAHARRGVPGSD